MVERHFKRGHIVPELGLPDIRRRKLVCKFQMREKVRQLRLQGNIDADQYHLLSIQRELLLELFVGQVRHALPKVVDRLHDEIAGLGHDTQFGDWLVFKLNHSQVVNCDLIRTFTGSLAYCRWANAQGGLYQLDLL